MEHHPIRHSAYMHNRASVRPATLGSPERKISLLVAVAQHFMSERLDQRATSVLSQDARRGSPHCVARRKIGRRKRHREQPTGNREERDRIGGTDVEEKRSEQSSSQAQFDVIAS
jgi:hypothetical protein